MKKVTIRPAFTMIELLFVIVVLGIVGGLALEAVRQYYEGIYRTGEYAKRSADADHILDQLSKYFEYAIDSSIVNIDSSETCLGRPDTSSSGNYTVAFVGVDRDGLQGIWDGIRWSPTWSEEVMTATGSTIVTASDTNYTAGGISNNNDALFDDDINNTNICDDYKWNSTSTTTKYNLITAHTDHTLTLQTTPANGKRKYLLRSGYAFKVESDGKFVMYDNFRPWKGETYSTGRDNTLGENVAHFYVNYASDANESTQGLIWRLKVCMQGIDTNLSNSSSSSNDICRERTVHVRY
ncbi:MAG: type II secretion system protein [Sulfuricurvum sp.]|nr:type II secretion system protein [Sulfuricurvum sp.]